MAERLDDIAHQIREVQTAASLLTDLMTTLLDKVDEIDDIAVAKMTEVLSRLRQIEERIVSVERELRDLGGEVR